MRKISIFVSNTYEMKRFFGFVTLILLLNACDDGEVTVQTIDFTTVPAVKCNLNDIIYKLAVAGENQIHIYNLGTWEEVKSQRIELPKAAGNVCKM